MGHKETLPYDEEGSRSVAIDTLRVEVTEGPDAGTTYVADSERLTVGTANGNNLELSDPTVSRFHVELVHSETGVVVIDHGSTNGTFVGDVRIQHAVVPHDAKIRLGATTLAIGTGAKRHVELYDADSLGDLHGRSDSMRRLMRQIQRAAKTEASALIIGESGTGKELIARALHSSSKRADQPFITVDCASMSPNLIASELFGHEKGAFTGADRRHIGAFERAHGGTIFLDEIGELPAELQPNLLGALERRRFRRVGGRDNIDVDVRVIAATNRDLRAEVNEGQFRLDLYYRVAVVTLRVAPLRERPEDIDLLIDLFLKECGYEEPREELFTAEVIEQLHRHRWPGNVRELRNVVEATVAMGEAPLEMVHEPASPDSGGSFDQLFPLAYREARATILHQFEREYISYWLERTGGNVAKAAREARMDRSHLFTLLRRHELR